MEVCPILIVIYPPPGWLARSVSERQGVPGPGAAQMPMPMVLEGLRGGLKAMWGTVLSSPRFFCL